MDPLTYRDIPLNDVRLQVSITNEGGERGLGNLLLHYAQTGHTHLTTKVYPEGRHEMLNDINRDEVMADWLNWFESNMPKKSPAQ